MKEIEKARELLRRIAYEPKKATDRPQSYIEKIVCEALSVLETEKPTEDDARACAVFVISLFAKNKTVKDFTEAIQHFAETYHDQKCKERAEKFCKNDCEFYEGCIETFISKKRFPRNEIRSVMTTDVDKKD